MKSVRAVYLLSISLLACAHLLVTLSFWSAPVLVAGGSDAKLACFLALFGGWILAGVSDLWLAAYHELPLSFAVEAAFSNACLAMMAVLSGGVFYLLCAVVPAVLVLLKVSEELIHHAHGVEHSVHT